MVLTSPQRDFENGYLRRRLRGVPGDPNELGSLGAPFPRRAAHPRHRGDVSEPGGACRRPDVLATGIAQGIVPAVYDDVQQHRVGEGVVLPLQRQCWPPRTPTRC
jgi:hypothetical protein